MLKELDRELGTAENYIADLETKTLLSGESDHQNADACELSFRLACTHLLSTAQGNNPGTLVSRAMFLIRCDHLNLIPPVPLQESRFFSNFYKKGIGVEVPLLEFRHVRLIVSKVERHAQLNFR